MEEKNNSKQITFGTYAVIVTIVFLVLLVGILAGMLIEKNKEEKVANITENVVTNVAKENEIKEEKENNRISNEEVDKIAKELFEKGSKKIRETQYTDYYEYEAAEPRTEKI